jgi:TfoX/Sxy family transcriptional regulator of competence genes
MDWDKSSAELVDLFTALAPKDHSVERKKMFGWPCVFVNGNLFGGLHKESMLFRLSTADQAIFLQLDGAAEFEPMPGRKMKGYVVFSSPLERDRKELGKWLARSLEYAKGLPAKAKKPPKSAAKRSR